MKQIILYSFLLFITFSNVNADQNRRASFYGIGNESCGTFLSALDKTKPDEALDYNGKSYISESRIYSEWLLAYVTAYNLFNNQKNNIDHANSNDITFWAKNYCEKKPMSKISHAAWALIIEQGNFNVQLYK